MRISDWSSDVCSSDLQRLFQARHISVLRPRAEELLVTVALNLDQVRHFGDFVDIAENLADTLGRGGTLFRRRSCLGRHVVVSPLSPAFPCEGRGSVFSFGLGPRTSPGDRPFAAPATSHQTPSPKPPLHPL